MALGGVFRFDSDQAVGHDNKVKLHVYLCKTDHFRAPKDSFVFLFISSSNYGNCMRIQLKDYKFLTRDSYISCNNLLFYPEEYLKKVKPKRCGEIAKADLVALRNHLIDHEIMVQWQITLACEALKAAV